MCWRSVRIARIVLSTEQTGWIAAHHERPDGSGYPQGVRAAAIPEGAALLAIADAWDVMTSARPYSEARDQTEALAECASLAGRQFTVARVQALHGAARVRGVRGRAAA